MRKSGFDTFGPTIMPSTVEPQTNTEPIGSSNHRFDSFAFPRLGNVVKWHVDGNDYFYALSEMLEASRQTIMIMDSFISPELYLRRPPAYYPEWRLDRILKRKAEQGVRVFIILSATTERTSAINVITIRDRLESLHTNISVLCHPGLLSDKSSALGKNNEKVVIVDHQRAAIGNLSLSLGVWDLRDHPLADVHPVRFAKTLYPGKDYRNSKISNYDGIEDFMPRNTILEVPRLPWHGVHLTLVGQCVFDIEAHFIERWNFIKNIKHESEQNYLWLDLPQFDSEDQFTEHFSASRFPPQASGSQGSDLMRVQVVRSVSEWTHGVPNESSIQEAYIQLIKDAKHFIYIENECFISNVRSTNSQPGAPRNMIAEALVKRIIRSAEAGENFQVIVVLPELPALPGNFTDSSSTRIIMDAQWKTINRGGCSIYEEIAMAGYDPSLYIRFYHLRAYDRINAPMDSYIGRMETHGNVKFSQAQAALSRIWLGDNPLPIPPKIDSIKAKERRKWSRLLSRDRISKEFEMIPRSVDHAKETIYTFQRAVEGVREYEYVTDSVAHHAMRANSRLLDEKWYGKPYEEKQAYVSEMIYVNSNLMIVDDRRAIIGSANINDQSQMGDRDSEIALVVEDTEEIPSIMDGQSQHAARFTATLRRMLYKEHLGLLSPQNVTRPEPPTCFMRAAPYPNIDETRTYEDLHVTDPLSISTIALWRSVAKLNTAVFNEVFRPIPSDAVRTMEQLKATTSNGSYGRMASDVNVQHAKLRLDQVHGHLVEVPLQFLVGENWITSEDDPAMSKDTFRNIANKTI